MNFISSMSSVVFIITSLYGASIQAFSVLIPSNSDLQTAKSRKHADCYDREIQIHVNALFFHRRGNLYV